MLTARGPVHQVSARSIARFVACFLGAGGTLRLPPGRPYRVASSGWDQRVSIFAPSGAVVVSHDLRGMFALRAPVTWGGDPAPFTALPRLLYFSWYLAVRHYREAAAAAAAASV